MEFKINTIKAHEADLVMLPVYSDNKDLQDEKLTVIYKHFRESNKFKGNAGEICAATNVVESGVQDIIFIGLGSKDELTTEIIRGSFGKAIKKAIELKAKKIALNMISNEKLSVEDITKSMVEGIGFGEYRFDKYKTEANENSEIEVSICTDENGKTNSIYEYIDEALILVETTKFARDLVNEPANVLYPETLSEKVIGSGNKYGFEVEVFDEKKINELGMESFLSVAKGSELPPRLIVMRYFGDESKKDDILGLVGKGVTYDSGGYSIKPTSSMDSMKSDMGGAASVIGAISAIAKKKLKINVVGVIAACENLISGAAYKPGDIIGSMAGKYIEVLNTDAEGRLTLIDAVHYIIEKEKVNKVIDLATLTGAALVALGVTTTAVVSNNDEFYKDLENASLKADEKVWRLPNFDDYKKLIKSDIADLKNTGGRHAGTITAGLFIGEFVQNKPWLHLDIAGTAWTEKETSYCTKGGTGVGVRTLYYLAKNRC
ncbi:MULTISPECIES: leucyl aminopeptidase [Clostridium]|uniref:Probable cytosol aminopeptidase n=1 Tax=Clostridium beijerinckii TaxID=1520 RepID=A0A1S9N738_CLOBE|nr:MULTISPECIES: leucyl aminopeptidase [Clostridium]MBN7575006.1 leucyl aminopeptidase [Clostridium beijerinckii]MBN7577775.1 leucyl aminopeptidase [Clostridium beijerinckii]MBN7584769.1 leucyl aminopeptidase [Clostridium beijerinckii]MBO0518758.1 leucyl aminopeptidase [Clostridium beijerinckii]OOP73252.1 leucyl aminopeptidase [Clostridium beijerinckii]